MKRLAMGLMVATLVLNLVPSGATLSFLTSEKKQGSPVSTGTNEDVFVTETKQIVLKSKVSKHIKVTHAKNADGTTSEKKETKLSINAGAEWITLMPQRPQLDLEVENVEVTGDAASEIEVQKQEADKGIVFRIGHDRNKIGRKSKTEKGEIRITALGGFYKLSIPLTVVTSYSESADVTDVPAPDQPQQPGTSDTPPSGDPTTAPSPPPAAGSETPPAPPATDTPSSPPPETSGPAPPSTADTGNDPVAPPSGHDQAPVRSTE